MPLKRDVWKFRAFAISFSLASLAFWILGAAPAALSPDSLESWRQIKVWEFWDGHPVVFTLWLWVTSFFGKSIFLAAIIQALLLFVSVFYLIFSSLKGRDWSVALLITGILNFTPFIGQMGMTLWKDIPYVAFTLVGIVVYFSNFDSLKIRLLGLAVFSFGALMRHDGILFALMIYAIIFCIKIVKFRGNKSRTFRISLELIISLFMIYGLSSIVPSLMNASPVTQTQSTYPLMHDIAYVYSQDSQELPKSVSEQMQIIVTGKSLVGARNCGRVDDMIMSPGYNAPYIDRNPGMVLDMWLKSFRSSAFNEMLYVHFCRAKAYLPGFLPETYVWTYLAIDQNELGLEHYQSTSKFLSLAATWSDKWSSIGRGLAHPGTWAIVSLLSLIYFRKKYGLILTVVLAAGVVKNLQNLIYTTGPYYRYGLLTQITGLLGLSLFIDYQIKHRIKKSQVRKHK
jgi:hypothetical protein